MLQTKKIRIRILATVIVVTMIFTLLPPPALATTAPVSTWGDLRNAVGTAGMADIVLAEDFRCDYHPARA